MPGYIKIYYIKLTIVFLLISLSFSLAQENKIKSVEPKLIKDDIFVSCQFNNLVDEEMMGTLASGMSLSLNFHLQLNRFPGETIYETSRLVKFRYNVWDKTYLLLYSGKQIQFTAYDSFKSFLYDSLSFKLTSARMLPKVGQLQFRLTFLPQKLSAYQKEKLDYWITNESETKESNPARESESGFSINLSRLISLFLDNKTEENLQEIKSAPFTIQSLRKNENTSK